MDRLTAPIEWKAVGGADHGELEGHAAVFNNIDLDGDVVLPGAFKKTLADWAKARAPLPLTADHDLSTAGVIGSVSHAVEDGFGLKVRARFSSVPKAQEIRTKMVEGHLRGMSFIYEALDHYRGQKGGQPVRFLRELRLYETTVSPAPRNLLAQASAKAVSTTPWSQFTEADYTPEQWRRACLIDTGQGDIDSKSRYKIPVREPSGTLNRNGVHAAAGGHGIGAVTGVSAEKKAAAARALMRLYGEIGDEPPDSLRRMAGKSLSFVDFRDAMTKAFEIPILSAAKAATDLLVADYQPTEETPEDDAAGPADGQPTADAAAGTGQAGTAQTTPDDAAAYAVGILQFHGPRDDAPSTSYPDQLLASLHAEADLNALEAQINQALGRTP